MPVAGTTGQPPGRTRPATLAKIADLKRIYGLDLDAQDSHRLREDPAV